MCVSFSSHPNLSNEIVADDTQFLKTSKYLVLGIKQLRHR